MSLGSTKISNLQQRHFKIKDRLCSTNEYSCALQATSRDLKKQQIETENRPN